MEWYKMSRYWNILAENALTTIVKHHVQVREILCIRALEDLMAGIYEMAAPDGIICNEVSKFLYTNRVAGRHYKLWDLVFPVAEISLAMQLIQKKSLDLELFSTCRLMAGTLNEAITGLIENECRQIELAEGHPSLRLG